MTALLTALAAGISRAVAQPTVTGPEERQTALDIPLAGAGIRPVSQAIEIDFEGDCLQRDALVQEVTRWVEHGRVNSRISISITGEQRPVLGARFWLLVDGQRASLRRFESFEGSCAELRDSLSAAIGLAIEAVDLNEFPAPPPPEPPPSLPVSELTERSSLRRDRPPAPKPTRPRRPGPIQSALVGVRVIGATGTMPGNAAGLGVRGELGFAVGLSTRLGANYLMSGEQELADGSVSSRSLSGQLGVCWGGADLDVSGHVCLDALGGAVSARPSDLERASEGTLPWFALAPGAEVRFHSRNAWAMILGAQLSLNLVRPRFEVLSNVSERPLDQYSVPPLGFIGTLGLDYDAL